MSGTSADSIDAALVSFDIKSTEIIATHSLNLALLRPDLKTEIHALATPGRDEIHRVNQLDRALGLLFAQTVNELLQKASVHAKNICAIGSHGQTIRHFPSSSAGELAYSVQVGDPNTIAAATGITTIADFRRRDIALGGQGAPLVPAFHQALFEKIGSPRTIINIGGIANVTLLTGNGDLSSLIGFDTGPGNGLMDRWIKQHQNKNYDDKGQWAAQGDVIDDLLTSLMDTPYLQQLPPKSTGPELFNSQWLAKHLALLTEVKPVDVQATLLEFTAQTITQALNSQVQTTTEIFFCGGGAYNTTLMQRLKTLLHPNLVASTAQLNIAPEWVEAAAFAWLAKQTLEQKPSNVPKVTGASKMAILGGIYSA